MRALKSILTYVKYLPGEIWGPAMIDGRPAALSLFG
jgi:hypothetical protein